jgi:hypothetical protein
MKRIGAVYAHRSVSSFIQASRIDAYELGRAHGHTAMPPSRKWMESE